MNKAEIVEIKKQFSPDRCTIDRICGCYVDHEKNKVMVDKRNFGTIPEEEMYKYLDIFKHTLTGTIGKNLIPLEFPLDQEEEGGTQNFLLHLRDTHLEDDSFVDEFYDRVIANYVNPENYLLILVHAVYDIPGVTSDHLENEDASNDVYDYVVCSICPVKLSKAALGYNEEKNSIEDRFRDWIVDGPVKGMLFPAFIDRNTDIHNMLYFTKKPDDLQPEFVEALFGGRPPMSAPEQKDTFEAIISDTIGDNGSYQTIKNIHNNLEQLIEDHENDETPLTIGKEDMKDLLTRSGVAAEKMENFEKNYENVTGTNEDYPLLASNVANAKKFQIVTPDVEIKVNPERTDLVETRIIDGQKCLVIKVDDRVEVNGFNVDVLDK